MAKSEPATAMTGGDAIVRSLIANGVDTVFGLPGAQLYPLFDALRRHDRDITTIGARHEQACGYMAFGYARSTGRPGVFAVVPGPGVLNTAAAIVTALGCCQPVLCITGQVPSAFMGRGRGHLHEIPDQLATLKSITKWSARIERAADAPEIINEAFRQMLSGRPGPVAVEMAWDAMAMTGAVLPATRAIIPAMPPPSPDEIERAADLLFKAERPMIMTGSGAQGAAAEVLALAEAIAAPVAAFRGGRGVVAEDHPLGISSYAAWRLWPEIDVVIGIGTRLEMPTMRWTGMMTLHGSLPPPQRLIRIDIDPSEMHRLKADAGIVADAAAGTAALLAALQARKGVSVARAKQRIAHFATVKDEARDAIDVVQPQLGFLDVIRRVLPREAFLVPELSQVGFTSYFGYPVLEPRTYVSEGYQGTLGFGFPTALGVKVAHPQTPVVSITGDGGFMFAVQELATAKQYAIALVTILFDNRSYGNVMRDQQERFGNRQIGAALDNPDFVALGKAFGVETTRVTSAASLEPVLAKAIRAKGPTLIVVEIPQASETSPWPFIHPVR